MKDDASKFRNSRNDRSSRGVLVTKRELLISQMLLLLADRIARDDEDQEFIELYNAIKPLAEGVLRNGTR